MLKTCLLLMLACIVYLLPVYALAETDQEAIAEAIAQETSTDYVLENVLPTRYVTNSEQKGTLQEIRYETRDYFGDGEPYTKRAFVYLPYGYSEEKQYKVLILCHGIGGNEYEWGMAEKFSKVRMIMDRLIEDGDIEPFIVVTPNGKAGNLSKPGVDKNTAYMAFYQFGQELRNDLLPYLDANFSTYGKNADALADSRDYRGMAGLSMGGMQTINIGMCECLDLFSWFGAFSAAPTSYPAAQVAGKLKAFPGQEIHFFYNICGTNDAIAYTSASAAAKNILAYTDRLNETNYAWQEQPGGHDFGIWYLGFYNFARIFGAE